MTLHTLSVWTGPRPVVTILATPDKILAVELATALRSMGYEPSVHTNPSGASSHALIERCEPPLDDVETYNLFVWGREGDPDVEWSTLALLSTDDESLVDELAACVSLFNDGDGSSCRRGVHDKSKVPWVRRAPERKR